MALSRKLASLVVVGFTAALSAQAAGAELATWDQTHVTQIAQQLVKACDAWWLALRQQPPEPLGSGGALDEFGLVQKARVLHEQSAALAADLAEGKGRDHTRNTYRSLKEVTDDTEAQAEQTDLDDPTLAAWAKVADLMRQIAPYYDPNALNEAKQGAGE